MSRSTRYWMDIVAMLVVAGVTISLPTGFPGSAARAEPPKDQTYVGAKKCASCHFDQYLQWRKTGHSKAFALLTAKYQKDENCLKCHTTGHGQPTGFVDMAKTPELVGISCESCHGPGSKHDEIAQQFKAQEKLTAEQEEMVRGSIWKMLPENVCVTCHNQQAHKESQTPPELRKP